MADQRRDSKKWVVHFIISDTFYAHLPKRKQDNIQMGTAMAYVCPTRKAACDLANKLIFLTTGQMNNIVFRHDDMMRRKIERQSWSNDMKTHHCEVMRHGIDTEFNRSTRKGEALHG